MTVLAKLVEFSKELLKRKTNSKLKKKLKWMNIAIKSLKTQQMIPKLFLTELIKRKRNFNLKKKQKYCHTENVLD